MTLHHDKGAHKQQNFFCYAFGFVSGPNVPNLVATAQQNDENKGKQSKVVGEIRTNKYQLHMPRRFWNSNLEVHERSHIAGVSLPPMHLPKAPPNKIGNYEGFLTTMVPWKPPEKVVTDGAHKKIRTQPKTDLGSKCLSHVNQFRVGGTWEVPSRGMCITAAKT